VKPRKRTGEAGTPPATRQVGSVADALRLTRESHPNPKTATEKKNFAETFSRHLAVFFANNLRPSYRTITPTADGRDHERPAKTAKGYKKLDINYSTHELGLALGVSIKTINHRDRSSNRYTKNYTRVDNELRAEATDYHRRQPYAILIGVLFIPIDSCDDGKGATPSSFGAAVKSFRPRGGRVEHDDDLDKMERFFVGLYEHGGACRYFDVAHPPPRSRRPREDETLTLDGMIQAIHAIFEARNTTPFAWADE
jgi:hypothetical protein